MIWFILIVTPFVITDIRELTKESSLRGRIVLYGVLMATGCALMAVYGYTQFKIIPWAFEVLGWSL